MLRHCGLPTWFGLGFGIVLTLAARAADAQDIWIPIGSGWDSVYEVLRAELGYWDEYRASERWVSPGATPGYRSDEERHQGFRAILLAVPMLETAVTEPATGLGLRDGLELGILEPEGAGFDYFLTPGYRFGGFGLFGGAAGVLSLIELEFTYKLLGRMEIACPWTPSPFVVGVSGKPSSPGFIGVQGNVPIGAGFYLYGGMARIRRSVTSTATDDEDWTVRWTADVYQFGIGYDGFDRYRVFGPARQSPVR